MEINPTTIALITAIASFVTAIAAIIAPVVTTYLNNKTQFKLKTFDMFYKEKTDAYQKFCISIPPYIDELIASGGYWPRQKREYLQTHQVAYLLADNKTRSLLDDLENSFMKQPIDAQKTKEIVSKMRM